MARTALDDLIDIYKEAQLALIKIITGKTGAGTKTYYNTILKQTEALLNCLSAQTGRYIRAEIPKEYKAALDQTYDYFKRNNLRMKRPESFAQVHSDAVSELASEMQHHINEGISSAGRRVMRYADTARDNALRQNGLRASAVKIASGQTVRDMQKDLTQRLSEDGFLTVQYGSGKYAYQVGLDSYAAMVARSTTREAGNLAREKQLVANGYDLVIITKHSPTCELCARVQGRVFSISGNDKRFPPLSEAFPSGYRNVHPNCRCVAVPWIEELQSPEELRAAIAKGSQPLKDERSDAEKALYTQQQSDRRQMRADLIQYERYKARLGDDAPQTFSAFRRMKNAGGDRWETLQKEYRQRFEKAAEERGELLSQNKVDIHKIPLENDNINVKIEKRGRKLSLNDLEDFENWQNDYYTANSGASFTRQDNPNIFEYTGGSYEAVNGFLRGGESLEKVKRRYGTAFDKEKYERISEGISSELSKFKLNESLELRRSVSNVDFITGSTSSVEDMKKAIGKTFVEKGFTSTTVCSDTMLPFGYGSTNRTTLEIFAEPRYTKGAYIYKISEHPAEFEFLIDKNTAFKVVDAGEREIEVKDFRGNIRKEKERYMRLQVIKNG